MQYERLRVIYKQTDVGDIGHRLKETAGVSPSSVSKGKKKDL